MSQIISKIDLEWRKDTIKGKYKDLLVFCGTRTLQHDLRPVSVLKEAPKTEISIDIEQLTS